MNRALLLEWSVFSAPGQAALFALAYFAGAEVGYALSLGPSVGGTFWPPSGITLAVFLLAPQRTWPSLVAAGVLANFVSDQLHGQNLPASFGFALANLAEPVIGAYLLRRFLGTPFTFSRLSEVVTAVAVVVFISAPIGAVIGGLTAEFWTKEPPGFASSWRTWWIGDACGAVVLAPTIVRCLVDWPKVRHLSWRQWLEAAAFVLALVVVTQIVFTSPPTSVAAPFLVFPILLWASVRFGVIGVGGGLCLVVLLTTRDTAAGLGPFAAEHLSIGDRLIALQIYVGVMALSFHVLAVLWGERARAAAALRQTHFGLEARYRRVVEQSPLGVLTVLPNGHIREANPAWQRWGLPFHVDASIHDDPHYRELVPSSLLTQLAAGETVELPELWTHGTSERLCLRGIAYPVKDETGGVAEIVIIARDITSEQRAQAHRERLLDAERSARGEAERVSRIKDEFLATLSHELRTPLSAIMGWVHILRRGRTDDETLARAIETIDRNARAQTKLIDDLLDVARITAGKVEFVRASVALADVVGAAVDSFRPEAEAKGLTITFERSAAEALVHGDAGRLQQVFRNLLGNAIKFTPAGGCVEVRLSHGDGRGVIVVRDSGQGISADFLPSVFDRFRQGDGSITRRHGGLGLGLSIAKQIVELHGGTITAQSDGEGRGATFTVALPLLSAEPGAAAHDLGAHADLTGLRVLVVDDEPDACEVLSRVLAEHGCEVAVAGAAGTALEQLEHFRSQIVVSDIGMPGIDGYELLKLMRDRHPQHRFSAIAVTAFARSEDRDLALGAGFDAHLAKPLDPAQLIRVLARLRDARP
jgi:signal transduction histidine kinase/integral membrane sensor domain MASE1/CheY-like chemotaxis protein